ncbi:MAG: ketopantoate reductase family protein [Gemmatimonadetes bacterium]|nr:ketopantoate reductase family protein [Gemmatimonadota bacterium]
MRFAVVGAGGLGGYLGALLARAGEDVHLVARGAHREAIVADGLRIREPAGEWVVRVPCAVSAADVGRPDVVLITVKTYDLDAVAPSVRALVEQGALAVPLLNGVDAVERLVAAGVRADRVLAGLAYVTAFKTGPGVLERQGEHRRMVLSPPAGAPAGFVTPLARALARAGVDVEVSADLRAELWRKMGVVCALATLCAPARSALGPVRAHPHGRALQERAVAEVARVARALGVPVPDDEEAQVHAVLDAFPDTFYPSLLHDLRTGRRTEVHALNATVARLARQAGIEAPLAQLTALAVEPQPPR